MHELNPGEMEKVAGGAGSQYIIYTVVKTMRPSAVVNKYWTQT